VKTSQGQLRPREEVQDLLVCQWQSVENAVVARREDHHAERLNWFEPMPAVAEIAVVVACAVDAVNVVETFAGEDGKVVVAVAATHGCLTVGSTGANYYYRYPKQKTNERLSDKSP
jgi:hypothetical protein